MQLGFLSNKFVLSFLLVFMIITFGFQNCSRTNFKSASNFDATVTTTSACSGEEPSKSNSVSCPTGSTGSGVTTTRSVACVEGAWLPGGWSDPNYSQCTCAAGKTINPINGQCECAAGQAVNSAGVCIPSTCGATNQPSTSDSVACPSGSGTAIRSRVVTCNAGVWNPGVWSNWNYSTCNCTIPDQTPNSATGVCECPTGKTLSGGVCVTASCSATSKPPSSETLNCPTGSSGSYTRTRTVTCNSANNTWTSGSWTSNYSGCSCASAGQMFDATKNPVCQTSSTTCPAATKPTESRTASCPAPATGVVTSTRTVTCNGGTWSAPNFPAYNYSSCGCAGVGQTANATTGVCSCPANKPNLVQGVCTPNVCVGGQHIESSAPNSAGSKNTCKYAWPDIVHSLSDPNKVYTYNGYINGVPNSNAKISGVCSATGAWTNVQITCPEPPVPCSPLDVNNPICDKRIKAVVYFGRNDWDNFDEYLNEYHFVYDKTTNTYSKVVDPPDGTLYFTEMWVPTRDFTTGFPSMGNRCQYFGIDMTTKIQTSTKMPAGSYQFGVISDDGSILSYWAPGATTETILLNQDSVHATRLECAKSAVTLVDGQKLKFRLRYFQGPGPKMSLVMMYRPWSASNNNSPVACGTKTNDFFGANPQGFGSSHNFPGTIYNQLLDQGWRPVPVDSFWDPDSP